MTGRRAGICGQKTGTGPVLQDSRADNWEYERRRKHEGALSDRNKSSLQTGERKEGGALPDPERFLTWLHDKGLHVTLNVHPADGVRDYEDAYEKMGEALRMDPGSGLPIVFDVADEKLMEAYFEYLHHPLEKEGVDFWWIDWQQGEASGMKGLDPLWALNHYHYLDSAVNHDHGLVLSRYCGAGAHRYPLGFTGDTYISWNTLDYLPYFTLTASNVGYCWWSHDIGGHMMGYKDDELAARWTQLGLYSPIMRLHSSAGEFNGKEPWRFKPEAELAMGEALRQRHQMIPYLYSMNYRNYKEDIPLICPMYYDYPDERAAYQVSNQYLFGSELLIAPSLQKDPRAECGFRDGMASGRDLVRYLYRDAIRGRKIHGALPRAGQHPCAGKGRRDPSLYERDFP